MIHMHREKSWALDLKQRKSYILNFIVWVWLVFFFHFSSLFSFSSRESFRHNSRFTLLLRCEKMTDIFLLSFACFLSSNVISIHPVVASSRHTHSVVQIRDSFCCCEEDKNNETRHCCCVLENSIFSLNSHSGFPPELSIYFAEWMILRCKQQCCTTNNNREL